MPRSRQSENGYISRRIALDLQDAHSDIANLVHIAQEDLADGGDTAKAERALAELGLINFEMCRVQDRISDGELIQAEDAAMKLAASDKGSLKS